MEERPEPAATGQAAACSTTSGGFLAMVRSRLEALATPDADPRRTAAALALGVFLSFSPLLGLQILIGFSAALALRLSRVAMLVGLCANLPWIMIPWYAITTGAAAAILGLSTANLTDRLAELFAVPVWQLAFWGRGADLVGDLLLAVPDRTIRRRARSRRARLHRRTAFPQPSSRQDPRPCPRVAVSRASWRRRGASCRSACPRRAAPALPAVATRSAPR